MSNCPTCKAKIKAPLYIGGNIMYCSRDCCAVRAVAKSDIDGLKFCCPVCKDRLKGCDECDKKRCEK